MAKHNKPTTSKKYGVVKNRIEKIEKHLKKQRKRLDRLLKKFL